MEYFKKLDISPMKLLKMAGILLVAVIILGFGLSLASASFKSILSKNNIGGYPVAMAPGYGGGVAYDSYKESDMMELSVRNAASSIAPQYGGTTGNTAEAYEITDYSGSIETGNLDKTCGEITNMKSLDYVIFENANRYQHGCNYTFKVAKSHVEEILASIKKLNPREISENTRTIKNQVDDFTSEITILQKKAKSIDDTLAKAVSAYDEITSLATKNQDAATLAKIIDSKIQVIERLTVERINVNTQLDRLARGKAEQLDRLEYTYFNLSVYENQYVDGQSIKDSWKMAVKDFVTTLNKVAQGVTINLIALIFVIVQFALYVLIVLFVAKYGWKLVKGIWMK